MKIEAINIQSFRSINEVTLKDCGGFNVIIGKNNAGKSNIFMAINAFFKSLSKGQPLVLNPEIGKTVDHYNNSLQTPITITIFFQLSPDERDLLIKDIVSESPEAINSVDGIDPELRLAVTLEVMISPEVFAYVKRMVLCKPGFFRPSDERVVHTILRIDSEAAIELFEKAKRLQEEIKQINYVANRLKRLGKDDWNRLKGNPSTYLQRLLYRNLANPPQKPSINLLEKLKLLIEYTKSQSDLEDPVSSLVNSLQKEAITLDPLQHRVDSFLGQENSIPIYAINLIERISKINTLYLTERREAIGKPEALQLIDFKINRGKSKNLRAIQETVSAFLEVNIDAFRAVKASGSEDEEAELVVDEFLVQVNGAGIREALRLILDYELNHPNILLVEEPETYLHPALETSIMRYLKTIGKECQVFITTHSTNFLDTAEMRNVYLASRNHSTTVQLIDMEEAEQSIPCELGIRLSSLFMFDRLVFVEGPTDEKVIRAWASTCNINLAQASVGFVPMRGVRNLANFSTEAIINFLSKRRVSVFFMIDRDEREEDEVRGLSRKLGDKAKLSVLNKRELENYLLSSKAIAKFIKHKHELTGGREPKIVDVADIEQAIDKCADELKNVAIERRVAKIACPPIYPNRDDVLKLDAGTSLTDRLKAEYELQKEKLIRLEKEIETTIEQQTKAVESDWTTKKRGLVPGDLLLDNLCRLFGVRFKKEKDSETLASLMELSEIDPEIIEILESFVRPIPIH